MTRLALSHDASRFLLIPEEVVVASDVEDVAALFAEASAHHRHLTLRGGGTSLSGQGVTDGMLVDVRRRFRHVEVLDDGARVRAGAGASVAQVNAALRKYGRRIGPDPASAIAATIGGVIANNSSGQASGIGQDVFHTIDSLVAVLPSGRVIDTAAPDADLTLNWEESTLAGGLAMLRRRLRDNPTSLREVGRLWAMRNAMGYHLRALTDFARPSDILRQLMVGSEGTLGFIAEATLRTVPLGSHRRSHLAVFATLEDALESAAELVEYGFNVIDLFDVDAIRVIQSLDDSPAPLKGLDLEEHAALLLEIHADDEDELAQRSAAVAPALERLPELHELSQRDGKGSLWRVQHGIFTAMAEAREDGTSLLMEDFSVPREHIEATIESLDALFDRFGYDRSAITGHLTDCTLHFMLTEDFSDPKSVRRFRRFTQAFTRLVLRSDGVLKAQHGTGRVMAPFLERQVGRELYDVMRELKHLFDPFGILSPDVMFNEDPDAHLTNLKLMPRIEDSVNACVECGLCENSCPSSDLTLSPRQRIVLRRELAVRSDDPSLLEQVAQNYQYAAIDTCSTAGMCALACPIGIDTGELVREQKRDAASLREQRTWDRAARNWGAATRLSSTALTLAKNLKPVARLATRIGRRRYGGEQVWRYDDHTPAGSAIRRRPSKERTAAEPVAAYFPGCKQTLFAAKGQGVFRAFNELCTRAGVPVTLLDASKLCCGIPWKTRGLDQGYETMSRAVRDTFDKLPATRIVTDSSSCALELREMADGWGNGGVDIVDVVQFVADEILPELRIEEKLDSLLLYPSCSNHHLDELDALSRIAAAIADEVVVPDSWRCCGAHGDRGLLHPELPRAATHMSMEELAGRRFQAYVSTTRTCEVALSAVAGATFEHILEALATASR